MSQVNIFPYPEVNGSNTFENQNAALFYLVLSIYKHMVLHTYVNEYIITYRNTCMHCYYNIEINSEKYNPQILILILYLTLIWLSYIIVS